MQQQEQPNTIDSQNGSLKITELLDEDGGNAKSIETPKTILVGIAALIFQFFALIFFIGQFYERQSIMDQNIEHMKVAQEQMVTDLAVIKSSQLDQNRRLDSLENHPRQARSN